MDMTLGFKTYLSLRWACMLFCLLGLIQQPVVEARSWLVDDFGARPDGVSTNTCFIQRAIDAAAASGGGRVVFAHGIYMSGALFLKSGVELHLPKGTVLRAIQDTALYPELPTRVAGIEMPWPAGLVNIYQQTNVVVSGQGTIDGNGSYWWKQFWGEDHKGGMLKDYRDRGERWAVDYDCKRVRAVAVYECTNITVRQVTINRSGFWSLALIYSGWIKVDGVVIRANIGGFGPSSDGVDIDSSHDILVQNCDVDCNDDDFCLKSGRDADGLRVNRPTENVIIRNCVAGAGGGMFTIGSETSGGIRNVEVSHLTAVGTSNGIRLKSARFRGGVVQNVFIHDIQMKGVGDALSFELNWNPAYSYVTLPPGVDTNRVPSYWLTLAEKVEPPDRGLPEFRDIIISNVTATALGRAIFADGYANKPIHDIQLDNIFIHSSKAGSINHAADWIMRNVVLTTPDGSNLTLRDAIDVGRPQALKMMVAGEKTALRAEAMPAPTARTSTHSTQGKWSMLGDAVDGPANN